MVLTASVNSRESAALSGKLKIIATIKAPAVIEHILTNLKFAT
jgi:hypothetical protein